jgi:signal transduction histidine kinase
MGATAARFECEELALPDKTAETPQSATEDLRAMREENLRLRRQLQHCQQLASLGTMAAMVAHEFNNILTPIVNYAHLAQSNPKMVTKALQRTSTGGQRAADICRALLDLTQTPTEASETIDVEAMIRETLLAMARPPERDGIELILDVPDGLNVPGRRIKLQQVLLNLLLNARSAVLGRPAPRSIHIRAERDASAFRLLVQDNGEGIEADHLERIFEPFFSTKPRGRQEGSGLGLAICRDILRSMGGDIHASSTPGRGATFCITLPMGRTED